VSVTILTKVPKGAFVHGHTYQGHPAACAAALAVQRIINEERLLQNVQPLGALLSKRLKEEIGHHSRQRR